MAASWLPSLHEAPDEALRIICFHYVGGAASAFRPWRKIIPDPGRVSLSALQLPGRETRHGEPFVVAMPEVVDGVLSELRGVVGRPYVLFGHSLGGAIAYEVALRLQAERLAPPRLLAVSATRPPGAPRNVTYTLGDDAFLESIKGYGGTPDQVLLDRELLMWFMPRLRADTRLLEEHQLSSAARVACPLLSLYGRADPVCGAGEATSWRRHAGGTFEAFGFEGAHFYLKTHEAQILRLLTAKA